MDGEIYVICDGIRILFVNRAYGDEQHLMDGLICILALATYT